MLTTRWKGIHNIQARVLCPVKVAVDSVISCPFSHGLVAKVKRHIYNEYFLICLSSYYRKRFEQLSQNFKLSIARILISENNNPFLPSDPIMF